MAKRWIDSNMFRKGFLKSLPKEIKLFYIYLICECDHCGIWSVEIDVAKIRLGIDNLDEQEIMQHLQGRVIVFDDGYKWFLPQFISFQYGTLSLNNKLHNAVFRELTKLNLIDYVNQFDNETFNHVQIDSLSTRQQAVVPLKDKDKDKDKEKEKEKEKDEVKETENCQNSLILNATNDEKPLSNSKTAKKVTKPLKSKEIVKSTEKTEYQSFMDIYAKFYAKTGSPMRITGADGVALKGIMDYLNRMESVVNGNKTAVELWQFILDNWQQLDKWQQSQTELRQINSRLPNIIQQIKNSYDGKQKQTANNQSLFELTAALRSKIYGS